MKFSMERMLTDPSGRNITQNSDIHWEGETWKAITLKKGSEMRVEKTLGMNLQCSVTAIQVNAILNRICRSVTSESKDAMTLLYLFSLTMSWILYLFWRNISLLLTNWREVREVQLKGWGYYIYVHRPICLFQLHSWYNKRSHPQKYLPLVFFVDYHGYNITLAL